MARAHLRVAAAHAPAYSSPDPAAAVTEASLSAGEISLEEAIQAYQGWLADHPGHEMAQVQLTNLTRRR